jgi:hypothetical protein
VGFREPVDLKQILRQYEAFGGPRLRRPPNASADMFSTLTHDVQPEVADEPLQCGYGPSWCSTETALDIAPRWCWDVNGYYRGLGVHWRASRRELMEAYRERRGHEDVWLTYVFKQLLNDTVRREYDRAPLGEPFLDEFLQESLKRKAHDEAYRRTRKGNETHRDQVLDEWGLVASYDEGDGSVDTSPDVMQDDERSPELWEYSYYLWRTIHTDVAVLRRWQELLVAELSAQGYTVRFAVGLIGKSKAEAVFLTGREDFIFFVSEEHDPTPETAAEAVRVAHRSIQKR